MIEFKAVFNTAQIKGQGAPTKLILTLDGTKEDNLVMAALQSMQVDGQALYFQVYSEDESRPGQ